MKIPTYTHDSILGGGTQIRCDECGVVDTYYIGAHDHARHIELQHTVEHLVSFVEKQNERIVELESQMVEADAYLEYLSPNYRLAAVNWNRN